MNGYIYKICTDQEYQTALVTGSFRGSPVDLRDGYIHFSSYAQLQETARRHFSRQLGLMVLQIDPASLDEAALKWEPSRGGNLFPHLYTALDMKCVRLACPLDLDMAGRHIFPAEMFGEEGCS